MLSFGYSVTAWLVRKYLIPEWIVCFFLFSRPCHPLYALKVGKSQGLVSVPLEAGGRERKCRPSLPFQLLACLLGASVGYVWLFSFSKPHSTSNYPARGSGPDTRWPDSPRDLTSTRRSCGLSGVAERGPALEPLLGVL